MKTLLTEFRSAILFITILPAGKNVAYSPMGMIKFFPIVGLILGSILIGFDLLASNLWPPLVVAVLDVFLLILLTGAFHLDGLGDTADGMFSHRPKERVMEIMKDSRTGMMGLVAVVTILALKVAGIYALKSQFDLNYVLLMLLIIPAYSRAAMIFGIRFMAYGRKGTGTGLDLFEKKLSSKEFLFFLIPVVLSLFLGYRGLVLNVVFILTLVLVLWFYQKKLNCITGDMLGALNEIMEAVLLLGCSAVFI